jgi:ribonuclease J
VEIEHDDARIVLDLGLPLEASAEDVSMPAVAGLAGGDETLLGVLISHPHPDHHGLVAQVDPRVPIYIGAAAERILREAAFFVPGASAIKAHQHLHDRTVLNLGPFTVTPFLMDHSGYDAYALVVEAGGRRLLYSGDIRAHGRKRGAFERFVAEPPGRINALLLEGTHVRARTAPTPSITEAEVENRCAEIMRATAGITLACYSPQNVDRMVTFYRAAKRSGRIFVMDLYAASVARATGRLDTIPQRDWTGVRVYVPIAQRIHVKREAAFERVRELGRARIFVDELAATPSRFVLTFRRSIGSELDRAGCLTGAAAIWSLWAGYLDLAAGRALEVWLSDREIHLHHVHASGHAPIEDLQRFAAAVDADAVIPIHTSAPVRFGELFDRVTGHRDGEWWDV